MKKVLSFLLFLLTAFLFSTTAHATNRIKSINMDVYINKNGNATVTEVWDVFLNEGTEGYRQYTNLEGSNIENFYVSDDTGKTYTTMLSEWDINKSFSEKAYKNGYHDTPNGVELCWGISQYGSRQYTLHYIITNLVKQYSDVQGIYFNFLNLDQNVGKVDISIKSEIPFSLDNARIWAFGFDGTIKFVDGAIKISSDKPVTKSQYVVALVRFQSDLFETNIKFSRSFDDEYDKAFKGVPKNDLKNKTNIFESLFSKELWSVFFNLAKIAFIPALLAIFLVRKKPFDMYHHNYKNMKDVKNDKTSSSDNVEYYREIPCGGDIPLAYWVCYQYGLVDDNDLRKGIIGAYFTKWIYEEKLKIITKENKFDKYSMDISTLSMCHFDSEIESSLVTFLIKAGNGSNIINNRDFYEWSKLNFHNFDFWFSRIFTVVKQELAERGLLYNSVPTSDAHGIKSTNYFNIKKIEVDSVSEEVNAYAKQLNGLKNFMLDFGNVAEKEFFEVHTFKDYIVFACLLGIADKVEGQFKKLYPDYFVRYEYDFSAVSDLSFNIFKNYSKGHDDYLRHHSSIKDNGSIFGGGSSHDYSGTSSSSGGGGSSFSGGGHSAGGSSGGGFR